MNVKISGCKVEYEFSRLCFKADLIEPLDWDDYFCVITKTCVFKMSKREFYENFPNVIQSKSYQESKIYHYPKTPIKAEKFIFKNLRWVFYSYIGKTIFFPPTPHPIYAILPKAGILETITPKSGGSSKPEHHKTICFFAPSFHQRYGYSLS